MARKTSSNKKQTFRLDAPAALSVHLVGDFTQWQDKPIAMRKNPEGIWMASVDLAPGAYHYRFMVDGQWRDDPECALHALNPYGTQNAVRQVRA